MNYSTTIEKSKEWGITDRRIRYLCVHGAIPGAVRLGSIWLIPKDAQKPADRRRRTVNEKG